MLHHSTSTPAASLTRQAAALVLLLDLGSLAAACTTQGAGAGAPFDIGNMASPEPLPQNNVSTTRIP